MKKFFYCQSYQIFNLALYCHHNLNEDITVITADDNIVKACEFLNLDFVRHKQFIFNNWEFIKRSTLVKNEIDRIIKLIGKSELHFSHTQSALFCLLLIHKFNGKLVFHDFEIVYPKYKFPLLKLKPTISFLNRYTNVLLIWLIYHKVPLIIKKVNISGAMVGIRLDYIKNKSLVKHYREGDYYRKTLDLFKNYKLDFPSIQNLFIAQNYYVDYKKNPILFNTTLEDLFKLLKKYNFKFKKHPKFSEPIQISELEKLPDFLPVELFFNCVENCIVSFHSSSLITAGYFEKVRAISLIDCLDNFDNEFILDWKSRMGKLNSNILFPTSIYEAENMIIN